MISYPKALQARATSAVACLALVTSAAVSIGIARGHWHQAAVGDASKVCRPLLNCRAQYRSLRTTITVLETRAHDLTLRAAEARRCATDNACVAFPEALRIEQDAESELRRVEERIGQYPWESLKHWGSWMAIEIIVAVVMGLFLGNLLITDGVDAGLIKPFEAEPTSASNRWGPSSVHAVITAGIWINDVGRFVWTSVLAGERKDWFSWNSFCVDPVFSPYVVVDAFLRSSLYAVPLAVAWCLTDTGLCPKFQDSQRSVGQYLRFLDKWIVLGALLLAAACIVWWGIAAGGGGSSLEYAWSYAASLSVVALVIARAVRCVLRVRADYFSELETCGLATGAARVGLPASDPTVTIIGPNWWELAVKIGLALGGMLAAVRLFQLGHWLGID